MSQEGKRILSKLPKHRSEKEIQYVSSFVRKLYVSRHLVFVACAWRSSPVLVHNRRQLTYKIITVIFSFKMCPMTLSVNQHGRHD